MTTLKDISNKTGFSVTQVSRALNGYADVAEKTRLRVEAAAKELNYLPNLSARRLVTGQSNNIGFVKRHHDKLARDVTFMENFVELSRACSKRKLQLSFHLVEDDHNILDVYSSLYSSGAIGGFFVSEPRRNDERIRHLMAHDIPFVVHGKDPDQAGYAYVDIDNFAVGYELTQHLILRGHRQIALINGETERDYAFSRLQGYKKALEEYEIPYDPDLVYQGIMTKDFGHETTLRLMRFTKDKPTGIVCASLLVVSGVYKAIASLGYSVPKDVSVVGHDDALSRFDKLDFNPPVTVTRSPIVDAYQPLAEYLALQLKGEAIDNCQKIMPLEFVERQSVNFHDP